MIWASTKRINATDYCNATSLVSWGHVPFLPTCLPAQNARPKLSARWAFCSIPRSTRRTTRRPSPSGWATARTTPPWSHAGPPWSAATCCGCRYARLQRGGLLCSRGGVELAGPARGSGRQAGLGCVRAVALPLQRPTVAAAGRGREGRGGGELYMVT